MKARTANRMVVLAFLCYGEAFMLSFQRYCHETHDNIVG